MTIIERSVVIPAPIAIVWATLTNTIRCGSWNALIPDLTGELRPGAKIRVRISPPGARAMSFTPTVTEVVEGRRLEWLGHLGIPGLFDGRHSFTLEALHTGRTRLAQAERFTGCLMPSTGCAATDRGRVRGDKPGVGDRVDRPPRRSPGQPFLTATIPSSFRSRRPGRRDEQLQQSIHDPYSRPTRQTSCGPVTLPSELMNSTQCPAGAGGSLGRERGAAAADGLTYQERGRHARTQNDGGIVTPFIVSRGRLSRWSTYAGAMAPPLFQAGRAPGVVTVCGSAPRGSRRSLRGRRPLCQRSRRLQVLART